MSKNLNNNLKKVVCNYNDSIGKLLNYNQV